MPGREISLETGGIYHLVNRGIGSQAIFTKPRDYQRALETALFYQNSHPPLRYSYFFRLPTSRRNKILQNLNDKPDHLVSLIAYCFMSNHFHLLIRQEKENGTSKFMSQFANSYTRYFNTKRRLQGPIFQGKFKAVKIDSTEQLIHVSRYIHLNPYSAGIINDLKATADYPYSSFREYVSPYHAAYCQKDIVLNLFTAPNSYKDFVFNQADYQRQLQIIKHLLAEITP